MHVLWSAAILDGIERSPEHFFKRYNAKHPERGGAQRDPALGHVGAIKAARVSYTDHMNIALEQAHQSARLHPESLRNRGITYRLPETRLDPKDSNALKFDGEITPKMKEVLQHRQDRAPHQVREQNQNRLYWEQRKSELGITRDLDIEDKLAAVTQARDHLNAHVPVQRIWIAPESPANTRPVAKTAREYQFLWPADLATHEHKQLATDICATFFSLHPHVKTLAKHELRVTVEVVAQDASLDRQEDMVGAFAALVNDASVRAGRDVMMSGTVDDSAVSAEGVRGYLTSRRIELGAIVDKERKAGATPVWHAQGLSRQEAVDAIRNSFWGKDNSPAREKERNQAFTRRIQGEHARTGRPLQGTRQQPSRSRRQPLAEAKRALDALMRQLEREEEYSGGQAARVRLFEEERERDRAHDRSMSW